MSNTIAKKLAAVFGVGSTIIATHTDKKVEFSDANTKLSFDQSDEVRQPAGIYDVTIKSEDAIEQVLRGQLPEGKKAVKASETPARQSPSVRFDEPASALR